MTAMLTPGSGAPPWPGKQLRNLRGKPMILAFYPAGWRVCVRSPVTGNRFKSAVRASFSQPHGSDALYQGATSVGPFAQREPMGALAPEVTSVRLDVE
jgi:hypothetical protein